MYGDPQIVFAAAGLDRSAHLRADASTLAEKWADPACRVLLVWRSKLLMKAGQVVLLQTSHPVLKGQPPPFFLGLVGAQPIFAVDLSGWSPADPSPAADQPFLDSGIQAHPLLPRDMGFA
ncbi:MAG: NUDIX-like domain-containing protein, partial [Paracoccaceae bacterium]